MQLSQAQRARQNNASPSAQFFESARLASMQHAPRCGPIATDTLVFQARHCCNLVGAGWMAQELLTTFAEEIGSVTLTPIGPVASLRCALMTRSSARGRSGPLSERTPPNHIGKCECE